MGQGNGRQGRQRRSTLLVGLASAAVFVVLASGVLLDYYHDRQLRRRLTQSECQQRANEVGLRIENQLRERANDLAELALLWAAYGEGQRRERFMAAASRLVANEPSYQVVSYVDSDGVVRASAPPGKSAELHDFDVTALAGSKELQEKAFRSGESMASPAIWAEVIVVWVPIRDESADSAPLGAIAGVLNLERFIWQTFPADTVREYHIVVYQDGTIAFDTSPSRDPAPPGAVLLSSTRDFSLLGRTWEVEVEAAPRSALAFLPGPRPYRLWGSIGICAATALLFALALRATARARHDREAAQASEARFRDIHEHAMDGLLLADAETDGLAMPNRRICEMLGYSAEELSGMTVEQIHPTESVARILTLLKRQLAGETFMITDIPMLRRDGSVFFADISTAPVEIDGKRYALGMFRDISDRKRREEALEERITALTQPLTEEEAISLEQLFSVDDIQRIQDLFAEATGVASIITEPDGTPITKPSRFCRLCEHIIRKTPGGLKNCYHSDAMIGRYNPSGPIVQPCLSGGLWDAGASIAVGGHHVANWLIGQVRNDAQDEEAMVEYARAIGADEEAFREALREVPVMSRKQFDAVADALFAFAKQLSTAAYQNLQQARVIADRKAAENALKEALAKTLDHETEMVTLLESAQAVLECQDFEEAARRIFGACRRATGAAAGFVSLLAENGQENEPIFFEDGNTSCCVDPNLPMPIRGLREKAYRLGEAVFENDFLNSESAGLLPEGHVPLANVLLVPLNILGQTVGLLGLANKPGGFDEKDARLASAFGQQAAIALRNARDRDALRRSEEKYRTYVNASPVAIFLADEAGSLVDVNDAACHLLGYSRGELLGLTLFDIAAPADDPSPTEAFGVLKETGRLRLERDLRRKDEKAVCVDLEATALGQGRYLAFCSDVTERKSLQEQLQQSQKMEAIGQLAGGVAHDFNNLLQVINGHTELVLDEIEPDSTACADLEEVAKAGARAAQLVSQLLAFSRRQIMRPEVLDLNDVAGGFMKMLNRVIGEHIQLEFAPGHSLGTVYGDRVMVEQVLMNLAVNARDAMPEGGILSIATEDVVIDEDYCETHRWAKPGRFALLSVTDTGHGMDKHVVEHIFEPFFTTKEKGRGTGLGLATAYGIIRQHEGMIQVYSEPKKGTTFKVYIPIQDRHEAVVERETQGKAAGGTETILLAEDDQMVRDLARQILKQAGYTVIAASDGQEALDLLARHEDEIDLLLLDVVMPRLGGREVYDHARVHRPEIPVLFASGYSKNAIHTNFVLDEGLALIPKPFARETLLRYVREALDRKSEESP